MTIYQIISSEGVDLGNFEGEGPHEAVDAMCRDAGYESTEDAAKTLGKTVQELYSELIVITPPVASGPNP